MKEHLGVNLMLEFTGNKAAHVGISHSHGKNHNAKPRSNACGIRKAQLEDPSAL